MAIVTSTGREVMTIETEEQITFLEIQKTFFAEKGYPFGIQVLVVDNDQTYLHLLENMLQSFGYGVTKCHYVSDALYLLRQNKSKYDIVLTDVYMPDGDGFKLLDYVSKEMNNLPLIMVSSDGKHETIEKAILAGCCHYMVKPVNKESLKIIWQHAIGMRRRNHLRGGAVASGALATLSDCIEVEERQKIKELKIESKSETDNELSEDYLLEYGQVQAIDFCDDHVTRIRAKKSRLVWSSELHSKFVDAVKQIGYDNAVPKKILESMQNMGCKNISRENIASHLQKYRMYVNKAPSHKQSSNALVNNDQVRQHNSYNKLEGNECNKFKFNKSCVMINGVNDHHHQDQQSHGDINHVHDTQPTVGSNYTMAAGELSHDKISSQISTIESVNNLGSNQWRQEIEQGNGDMCFGCRIYSSHDQFHETIVHNYFNNYYGDHEECYFGLQDFELGPSIQ